MSPFWVQINSTHFGVIGQYPIWGYYPFYLKAIIMPEDQSAVVTLKVRVTPEFREKIVSTAKANNRSMNQEIVARLEDSFKESDDPKTFESLAKIVKETTEETTRLHKELVKIIEQQKIEIENLKKG